MSVSKGFALGVLVFLALLATSLEGVAGETNTEPTPSSLPVPSSAGAAHSETSLRAVAVYRSRAYAGYTKVILSESRLEDLSNGSSPKATGLAFVQSSISADTVSKIKDIAASPELAFFNPSGSWFRRADLQCDRAACYLVITWSNWEVTYWIPTSYRDVPGWAMPVYNKISDLCGMLVDVRDECALDAHKTSYVQKDGPIVRQFDAALEKARKASLPCVGA